MKIPLCSLRDWLIATVNWKPYIVATVFGVLNSKYKPSALPLRKDSVAGSSGLLPIPAHQQQLSSSHYKTTNLYLAKNTLWGPLCKYVCRKGFLSRKVRYSGLNPVFIILWCKQKLGSQWPSIESAIISNQRNPIHWLYCFIYLNTACLGRYDPQGLFIWCTKPSIHFAAKILAGTRSRVAEIDIPTFPLIRHERRKNCIE